MIRNIFFWWYEKMGLFSKKEETDPMKIKEKAAKDLVGGTIASTKLDNKLREFKLFPVYDYNGEIKKSFRQIVIEEDTPLDKFEERLDELIKERINNLSPIENELRELEIAIFDKENELKNIEDKEQKKELKKEIKNLKNLKKVPAKREKIMNGVKCKVPKYVQGQKGHSGLTKGAATLGFGLVGWAATSGSKSELQEMMIPSIIKVLPKGVSIEPEHEETIRIPFENIIRAENSVSEINIFVVGNQKFTVKYCDDYNEVTHIINEGACGKEEEGWVAEPLSQPEECIEETVQKEEDEIIIENNNNQSSDLNELERLGNLYEKGLLTDEEFAAMKKKIIEK